MSTEYRMACCDSAIGPTCQHQMTPAKLTPSSLALFLALAKDAGNWGGTPPTDGNVCITKEERGNLTQLKRAGLITTGRDEGCTYVYFTDAGQALAAEHDLSIY